MRGIAVSCLRKILLKSTPKLSQKGARVRRSKRTTSGKPAKGEARRRGILVSQGYPEKRRCIQEGGNHASNGVAHRGRKGPTTELP